MIQEMMKSKGDVQIVTDWKNGEQDFFWVPNTILKNGRRALARTLANDLGEEFSFYINRMAFGSGGTNAQGVKKFVNADRNGLFQEVIGLNKPVIANVDNSVPTQVIFTSVLRYEEAVGVVLSEMGLSMANGDFYSMTTFPNLSKTIEMQITFNWHINFI